MEIWVRDGKKPKPHSSLFYELASNSAFIHERTDLWDSVTEASEVRGLKPGKCSLRLKMPPIPRLLIREIVQFFAWIYKEHGTEVAVLLSYNLQKKLYAPVVPEQVTTHGSIHYNLQNITLKDGYLLVGSLHSHCDFGAFHSGIDEHDEADFDGIHVTFGKFSDEKGANSFEASIEAAIRGTRFVLDPVYWLSGVKPAKIIKIKEENDMDLLFTFDDKSRVLPPSYKPDDDWVNKVTAKKRRSRLRFGRRALGKFYESLRDKFGSYNIPKSHQAIDKRDGESLDFQDKDLFWKDTPGFH